MTTRTLAAAVALLAALAASPPASPDAPRAGTATAPAPKWTDFTLETPDGRKVTLAAFVGKKPVLLAFWATWCPYCNAAIPRLKGFGTGPLRDRMTLLAIDYLESREKVASFVRAKGIPYTVLLDRDGGVSRRYGLLGVPTYILIDRQGRIAWRDYELPENIEPLLR